MNLKTAGVIAVAALAAAAAWPAYLAHERQSASPAPTPAPIIADYVHRGAVIAYYEARVRRAPDQIITRLLAQQYLMRYRETGDVGDLLRAESMARRSLLEQPRFNTNAELTLASAELSLHKFARALEHAREAMRVEPDNANASAAAASVEMELGDYAAASALLRRSPPNRSGEGVATATARARYAELTGRLDTAQSAIRDAMHRSDSVMDNPAEARAWYHVRLGELAFAAGDVGQAELRFHEALDMFPTYARAYNGLAKLYWAEKRWPDALAAATAATAFVPLPETLGYEADAQRALGHERDARMTEDLIVAIERIGNAQHISDRALAVYYADHRMRLGAALLIARRDLALRDDIYAEDTLAWTLAQSGRWSEARAAARKALRLGTQDARMMYHGAVIFEHVGRVSDAQRLYGAALHLNPSFHPVFADDARRRLSAISLVR